MLPSRSSKNVFSPSFLPTLLFFYLFALTLTLVLTVAAASNNPFTVPTLAPTPGWDIKQKYIINGGNIIAAPPSYAGGGLAGGDGLGGGGYNGNYGGESSMLVLAPKRTHRKDPLNDFKYYAGGWNLTDHHYWASVAYSSAPLFIISVVWFVVFGMVLLTICLCQCCCRREPLGYSRVAYILSLSLLIIFTLSAIIGCFVLYTGQGKFQHSTESTLQYLVNQAEITAWKLQNVSEYLASAKQIGVQNVFLPSNVQTDIDQIDSEINTSAGFLSRQSTDTANEIRDVLAFMRLTLIVISAVMLSLVFLGFLFSMFGLQVLVYTLVVFGWILVTGTFILCGTFLLFHNAASDTCVAMHQWAENPTAHTALDEILPCVDPMTSQDTLKRSKEVTAQLVDLVNSVISNVSNINFGPQFKPFYFNQSGPLLPLVCNPFNPDLTDRICSRAEINLNNATQALGNYMCQADSTGVCSTTGRLTPVMYNQMEAAVNVSFGLYNYGPDLIALQDCSFVRETFTEIYSNHCPGLRQYSKWVYSGLVLVSFAVMLSLIFWIVFGRERKHRLYTKRRLRAGDKMMKHR